MMGEITISPSRKDEVKLLRDRIAIIQKYGAGLTDEQIDYYLEQERRKAEAPERKRLLMEKAAAERARIEIERKEIVKSELGKRILLSLNREKISSLNADGKAPCPACGESFNAGTDALMEIAEILRGCTDHYLLINRMGFGAPVTVGVPCVHMGASCPHCEASIEVLVQLVI